jgi:phosphoribosylformylglycinamidine synthase
VRFGIVRFPGTNCERDCRRAVEDGLGQEAVYLWHGNHDLEGSDVVIVPGGFSYGDYLRAGAIARFSPVMREVAAFARAGGPVVGICNGFQILCEARLLPGALLRNRNLRFRSHDCWLRVESTDTPFTAAYREGQVLRMPLSHGEGQYVADEATLVRLEDERRVVFRYVDGDGRATEAGNPNGSARNIAGVCNEARNVVGVMPHPDRAFDELLGSADGLGLFRSPLVGVEAGAA